MWPYYVILKFVERKSSNLFPALCRSTKTMETQRSSNRSSATVSAAPSDQCACLNESGIGLACCLTTGGSRHARFCVECIGAGWTAFSICCLLDRSDGHQC